MDKQSDQKKKMREMIAVCHFPVYVWGFLMIVAFVLLSESLKVAQHKMCESQTLLDRFCMQMFDISDFILGPKCVEMFRQFIVLYQQGIS